MSTLNAKLEARLNALRHGAYAETAILPGEDPKEFERLLAELNDEWKAEGPSERDCVLTMAKGIWRKARVQKFLYSKMVGCTYDPKHPLFDEVRSLFSFFFIVTSAPDKFEKCLDCLSNEHADHLRAGFYPENFDAIEKWEEALRKEIFALFAKAEKLTDVPLEALLDRSARIVTADEFENEVALEAANDAMIDRAFKRLVQIKGLKEMLGHTLPKRRR
jgi:hypothetical protein